MAPLQALLLLLVKELLLDGIEAKGDSKAPKGCLEAARTRFVSILLASLGPGLPVCSMCVRGFGEEERQVSKDGRQKNEEAGHAERSEGGTFVW